MPDLPPWFPDDLLQSGLWGRNSDGTYGPWNPFTETPVDIHFPQSVSSEPSQTLWLVNQILSQYSAATSATMTITFTPKGSPAAQVVTCGPWTQFSPGVGSWTELTIGNPGGVSYPDQLGLRAPNIDVFQPFVVLIGHGTLSVSVQGQTSRIIDNTVGAFTGPPTTDLYALIFPGTETSFFYPHNPVGPVISETGPVSPGQIPDEVTWTLAAGPIEI